MRRFCFDSSVLWLLLISNCVIHICFIRSYLFLRSYTKYPFFALSGPFDESQSYLVQYLKQTVGIIGTGNIGNEISRLCTAVGMRVIGASRDPERILANHNSYDQVFRLEELTGLLQQADHIVVTLPLNDQTRGLIGWKFLEEMKNAASLINVTRGAIVDEDALCKALAQGNIGAAYIDVPAKIPLPRWSRMHKTPNLVLTHYSSANSVYLINDAFQQFISGLEKLEKGSQPANRVL